uniref:RING-type domain-containing protein n=1 Tax=Leersia perrieri TaxID=77586 RepID=A0A0D9UZD6_9ORYZ
MEVGGVVVSLLFAAFSLPCLLLLLVVAEAGIRLASLAVRGGRLSWPSRSDFLRYRIARSGIGEAGGVTAAGEEDSTPPGEEWRERLAVAVYRREAAAAAVDCVFCLSRVDDGEEVRELRCRHVFHRACLDAWLALPRATCPLCRDCLVPPPSPSPPTPTMPPRTFPLDYYHDDDDIHFGFNDFSISGGSGGGGYHHGLAFWPM